LSLVRLDGLGLLGASVSRWEKARPLHQGRLDAGVLSRSWFLSPTSAGLALAAPGVLGLGCV